MGSIGHDVSLTASRWDRPWKQLPLGDGVRLLAADRNGLAALEKPPGVLSHPNCAADEQSSLLRLPYRDDSDAYACEPAAGPTVPRLHLLHRLDYRTSGVVLLAGDPEVAVAVRSLFRTRAVAKSYLALVFGRPPTSAAQWNDRLRGARGATEATVLAQTRMRVVGMASAAPPIALLELQPSTGRKHQLRLQCARRGLPIVGDPTYGDFKANRAFAKRTGEDRLFLHASSVRLAYRFGDRSFRFAASSETPPEFALVRRSAGGVSPRARSARRPPRR